jgi:hypothetical protein
MVAGAADKTNVDELSRLHATKAQADTTGNFR